METTRCVWLKSISGERKQEAEKSYSVCNVITFKSVSDFLPHHPLIQYCNMS